MSIASHCHRVAPPRALAQGTHRCDNVRSRALAINLLRGKFEAFPRPNPDETKQKVRVVARFAVAAVHEPCTEHQGAVQLLDAIEPLERGLLADEKDKRQIEKLCKQLEKANPNKKSLESDAINGKWELLYTTSQTILKTNSPAILRPRGPIYQFIDAPKLKAKNQETTPYFNSVSASLVPTSDTNVNVKFEWFKIFNLIPIKAPDAARGSLDTTYVDDELRISRGDKGNLFVLAMQDPNARL